MRWGTGHYSDRFSADDSSVPLRPNAPQVAWVRLRHLDTRIEKEEDARNALYAELEEAFNRFRGVLSGDLPTSKD